MIERLGKLQPAARDIGMRLAAHVERRVFRDRMARLVEPALAREHQPGHDQALRGGARLRQAALDQRHVEPRLGHAAA